MYAQHKDKRLRQSTKPLLNKLEQEWFDVLRPLFDISGTVYAQAIRFRLCNGLTFTPDFYAPRMATAWEVKGPYAREDSLIKLKMAAHEWPEITWVLVWKEGGQWKSQTILP